MSSLPTFNYKSYQDVLRNIFWYWVIAVALLWFVLAKFVLPAPHRDVLMAFAKDMGDITPLGSLTGLIVGAVVVLGVAFLVSEIFRVHDHWYDRYLVKSRKHFDSEYVLPRLVEPFMSRMPPGRFVEEAVRHRNNFMERLYYPFVGDQDAKIPKNTLLRFYEMATVYWISQVNEIVIASVLAAIAGYTFTGYVRDDHAYAVRLLRTTLVVVGLALLNRSFVYRGRRAVVRMTDEEIAAIHGDPHLLKDLEGKLRSVCADYRIPYQ